MHTMSNYVIYFKPNRLNIVIIEKDQEWNPSSMKFATKPVVLVLETPPPKTTVH